MLRALALGLLDLLAPLRCPACEAVLDPGGGPFCGACAPLLDRLAAGEEGAIGPRGGAAYVYGGPMAEAIRGFKYGGRSELAAPLGRLLAEAAAPLAGRVDRVIPVPLHPKRLRARGFNQAALLGARVASALGLPLDTRSLRRLRDTATQASLPREARRANVRGAFGVAPGELGRVLLVDDVRTTGATLREAKRALRGAGAKRIRTLVLAQAQG